MTVSGCKALFDSWQCKVNILPSAHLYIDRQCLRSRPSACVCDYNFEAPWSVTHIGYRFTQRHLLSAEAYFGGQGPIKVRFIFFVFFTIIYFLVSFRPLSKSATDSTNYANQCTETWITSLSLRNLWLSCDLSRIIDFHPSFTTGWIIVISVFYFWALLHETYVTVMK